jgi:6,7-dimethyl-8-ribityllumazine synthase
MFPSLARKHGNNHPAVTNDESQLLLTQHEQPTCPSPNQTTTHNPPVTTNTDHLSPPKPQNKMSPPIKGPGEARTYDGTPLRIGIVHARWNEKIIAALLEGTLSKLRAAGVREENIVIQTVPGSFELPYAVQRMYLASQTQHAAGGLVSGVTGGVADLLGSTSDLAGLAGGAKKEESGSGSTASKEPFDAIIAIGALIKGSTMHFEYISDSVSHALMKVQMETGCAVVFGLLTLLTEEQGLERAGIDEAGKGHNHGEDWGLAAVELGVKRRGWSEGKFVE